ncbi:MAG: AI-2E family transporter [Lachnospiraceae bacterium]|nr:AI-2E family transporter [Lachnospiraceae bacterium]
MNTQKKTDFLINAAYWGLIILAAYLVFEYIVPITVPFILGFIVAYAIVRVTRKLPGSNNRWVRLALVLLVYGTVGVLVALIAIKGFTLVSGVVTWLPNLYEHKFEPALEVTYQWLTDTIGQLDPAMQTAVASLGNSMVSSFNTMFSKVSGYAVNAVSGMVTGVPSLVLSTLAMIFSTVFVALDFEKMRSFTKSHMTEGMIAKYKLIRTYLTDTLLVVLRSYIIIMTLTFVELSILFSVFKIGNPFLKAFGIAVFDIMPVLGTGGIMLPWATISLVIGNTKLGVELFVIYGIVTVVRNYVEPKVVGVQLGLHPIITLVSMFIGLRLFGFWGLFGCPVVISFLWKRRQERLANEVAETDVTMENDRNQVE